MPKRTVGRPSTSPALGPIRTTYPGYKTLVVVQSSWNNTPAGRRAIDTVAAYDSALVAATLIRSIEPARRLADPGCLQCQSDINRIEGYLKAGQRVRSADGTAYVILAATIFISKIDRRGTATVEFTASNPGVKLLASDGRTLISQRGAYQAVTMTVDTRPGGPLIKQIVFK